MSKARYPNLRDYLDKQITKPVLKRPRYNLLAGLGYPTAFAATYLAGVEAGLNPAVSGSLALCVAIPLVAVFIGIVAHRAMQPKTEAEQFKVDLRALESKLLNWARRKSRERDPMTMAILEYGAEQFRRIETALKRPIWLSKDVESSWMDWRAKALSTSQTVMDEVIWGSRDLLKPGYFGEDDDDDDEVDFVRFRDFQPSKLPKRYQSIGKLVHDLKVLADAAAKQTEELSKSRFVPMGDANAAIDSTLTDLQNLRSAYAELGIDDVDPEQQVRH